MHHIDYPGMQHARMRESRTRPQRCPCSIATQGHLHTASAGTRHTFAVRTLLSWYRTGEDVQAKLPWLSTYLGHREPASTYWYLSAAPELLALAAARQNTRWTAVRS